MLNRILLAATTLTLVCACSDAEPPEKTSSSGGTSSGGQVGDGGTGASGAVVGTGAAATGGASATGGAAATGGATMTGGAITTGGTAMTGGTPTTGGTPETGGDTPTGGTPETGGAPETGGSGTGGETTTGGTAETGGAPETGGSGTGGATTAPGCDRDGLTAAADSYLAALRSGDPGALPVSSSFTYTVNESSETLSAGAGLFASGMTIDLERKLIDVTRCGSFTEIIAATNDPQYVIGAKIMVTESEISEIEVVMTREGHWGFDANAYLQYSSGEDWSIVPEGERLPYDELAEVGYLYFEYWGDRSVVVPWGIPCARLEGGMYTGDFATSSCDVGIPEDGFAPQPREHLVDVGYGMSVVLLNLGGADSHLFRLLNTGIRYVHTLTALEQ